MISTNILGKKIRVYIIRALSSIYFDYSFSLARVWRVMYPLPAGGPFCPLYGVQKNTAYVSVAFDNDEG